MKKESVKIFFRAASVTAVVLACITAVFLGICESYEGIRDISFEEKQSAVYICRDYIRILDCKIKI